MQKDSVIKISSVQNPKIIEMAKLKLKKYREQAGLFLVEGEKLIKEAVSAGYKMKEIFYKKGIDYGGVYVQGVQVYELESAVIAKLSEMPSVPDIIAVFEIKEKKDSGGNFLILDNIQDSSNIGAIARSAYAAGFRTIFVLDCADIYSTKALRSSMGAIFHLNIIKIKMSDLSKFKNSYLLNASMQGQNIFTMEHEKCDIGVVIGNEGHGVRKEIQNMCKKTISVPMQKGVESLNAAVSASIIMYAISYTLKSV